MGNLSAEVGKEEPLFAFETELSGSCSECTKAVKMDEADVLCFVSTFWLAVPNTAQPRRKRLFVYKVTKVKLARKHSQFSDKTLRSVHKVCQRFYFLVPKNVGKVLKNYKNLCIVDSSHVLHNHYGICHLELVWLGSVIRWQTFDLDVVPAFPVEISKLLRQLNDLSLLYHLFYVPKWTAFLTDKPYTQLGFLFPVKTSSAPSRLPWDKRTNW